MLHNIDLIVKTGGAIIMREVLGTDTAMTSQMLQSEEKTTTKIPEENLLEDLYVTFFRFVEFHRRKNIPLAEFSFRNYNKFRSEDAATGRTLIRTYGTWNNVVSMIPDDILSEDAQRKLCVNYFSTIINTIMNINDFDSWHDVKIRHYIDYQKKHNTVDWRTLSTKILQGKPHWKNTIRYVFEGNTEDNHRG